MAVELCEAVVQAAADGTAVQIQGGNSKAFYGRETAGRVLAVSGHSGVVDYEPSELVVTVRTGTAVSALEAALAREGQMLAFEPPRFGDAATVGGVVASGLSGPRRPYCGAVRDFVLGARIINGRGEHLRFGGQVMKNVAGYDVSRLMVGALGTLGVITEVSFKVLPVPVRDATLRMALPADLAIQRMNEWAARPLPISGTCHTNGELYVRLSGSESGVAAAVNRLGGDAVDDAAFWESLREQRLDFFTAQTPLWRVSVPPAVPPLAIEGEWLTEWGGAQRWLKSPLAVETIREQVAAAGGHAILFRGGDRSGPVFHPLPQPLLALHQRLKNAFDPGRLFNPGRLYEGV